MRTTFIVTGTLRNGRRFKLRTTNGMHAAGINLWRGSVWAETPDGKRRLLKRVFN